MTRTIRFVAAIALAITAFITVPTGIAQARLYDCSQTRVYQQVTSVCRTGTGKQRILVGCKATPTGYEYLSYGPWVGVWQQSTAGCVWPLYVSNYYTQHYG